MDDKRLKYVYSKRGRVVKLKENKENQIINESLQNKTVIIIGGSSGIGLAAAKKLFYAGANIVITGRSLIKLKKIEEEINSKKFQVLDWDITEEKIAKEKFNKAVKLFGTVDNFINCAGVTYQKKGAYKFLTMDEEEFDYCYDVNVVGTYRLNRMEINYLKNQGGGIINICSNTAFRPASNAYQISKWLQRSYTKWLIENINVPLITINGIYPGPVMTPMSWKEGESILVENCLSGRMSCPSEIAEIVYEIVLSDGKVTGQTFICDGGQLFK